MEFIFYIFTIICGYSLVISVPINQNSQETKHEKASAIANRILKELVNETLADQSSNEESQEIDIDYMPIIENFYPMYEDLSSSSTEIDDFDNQELTNDLEDHLK